MRHHGRIWWGPQWDLLIGSVGLFSITVDCHSWSLFTKVHFLTGVTCVKEYQVSADCMVQFYAMFAHFVFDNGCWTRNSTAASNPPHSCSCSIMDEYYAALHLNEDIEMKKC